MLAHYFALINFKLKHQLELKPVSPSFSFSLPGVMFTIRLPLTRHVSLRRMLLPEDTCDPSLHPAPVSHSPGHQPQQWGHESFENSNSSD